MFNLNAYAIALLFLLAAASVAWVISVIKKDAGVVDSFWGLFFAVATAVYALMTAGVRETFTLILVTLWATRLCVYISWRNWGEPEDHRYQAIRQRNEPNFALKSFYLVFGLQAVLAWIISLPLLAATASPAPLNALDVAGAVLFTFGLLFETVGDYQLARFKADARNRGKVMDRGLWRYTRHPNYFGEFCVWWGFYLIAFAAGGWWSIVSPLLMSYLLLKVSGVALLEKDIGERRPAYRDYVARTPAFFPGFPKSQRSLEEGSR